MTTKEAIESLDSMQRQIIHGKRTFGDIADVIRNLEAVRIEALKEIGTPRTGIRLHHEWTLGKPKSEASFAASDGSAAASELSAIINAARERGCAEHGHEIKWLLELPMTEEEMKRFNNLTGWPSRKQANKDV